MQNFDPNHEIEKFRNTDVTKWRSELQKYSTDDLQIMTAILMLTVFQAREKLADVKQYILQRRV